MTIQQKTFAISLLTMLAFAFSQMTLAQSIWYVATNGAGNGTSWADATNSIQGAIDASSAGDLVLVSNGVYATGGITNYPPGTILTNRVAIYKAITVRSANNDPTNTIIKGAWDPGDVTRGLGPAAVRCVYMTNNSSLIGFMLTNGATVRTNESAIAADIRGGGIHVHQFTSTSVISNCIVTCNSAMEHGGGVYQGALYNCIVSGNKVPTSTGTVKGRGAGASEANMYNCLIVYNSGAWYGGGVAGGVNGGSLYNCTIVSNTGTVYGGGIYYIVPMYNCLLTGNSANQGGGVYQSAMYNCTVVNNRATAADGYAGGVGSLSFCMYNCIVYSNTAVSGNGPNWHGVTAATNCCTKGGTGQVDFVTAGNITNYPEFADINAGNYRLNVISPCMNTGTNLAWMTNSVDLDSRPRIRYGTVDMGAYEVIYEGTIYKF